MKQQSKAPMQRTVTIADLIVCACGVTIAVALLVWPMADTPVDMTRQVEVSCNDGTTFDSGNGDGPDGTRGTGGGRGVRQVTA